MAKIEWNRPNSFYRDSRESYEATIGGMKAEIYFDNKSHPFVWKLNCRELEINKRTLQEKFEPSEKEAICIIKLRITQRIAFYKKILTELK